MADSAYSRFGAADLLLSDELAIDRTLLANERTLLAYLRGGLTLMIAGATIMHFVPSGWFLAMGVACLPAGAIIGLFGIIRARRMHRAIMLVRNRTAGAVPAAEPDRGGRDRRRDAAATADK